MVRYDDNADNPAWIKALAEVRLRATREGWCYPLNNVCPLNELRRSGWGDATVSAWINRWITRGLEAVEQLIGDEAWCFGEEPGLADIYLAPQLFSARRFKVPFGHLRRISRVAILTDTHPAFLAAAPQNQADAE